MSPCSIHVTTISPSQFNTSTTTPLTQLTNHRDHLKTLMKDHRQSSSFTSEATLIESPTKQYQPSSLSLSLHLTSHFLQQPNNPFTSSEPPISSLTTIHATMTSSSSSISITFPLSIDDFTTTKKQESLYSFTPDSSNTIPLTHFMYWVDYFSYFSYIEYVVIIL